MTVIFGADFFLLILVNLTCLHVGILNSKSYLDFLYNNLLVSKTPGYLVLPWCTRCKSSLSVCTRPCKLHHGQCRPSGWPLGRPSRLEPGLANIQACKKTKEL